MNNNISCPNCGNLIDVESVIAGEMEKKFQHEYQHKHNESLDKLKQEKNELTKAQEDFEAKKKRENEIFIERLETEKKQLENKLREQLSMSIATDYQNKITLLESGQKEAEVRLEEARKKEFEALKKEQELANKAAELEIHIQRQLQAERSSIAEQIRNQEVQKSAMKEQEMNLKMKELEKQLEDQKKLAEEMSRKAEQGSMQLQGEIQELALENLLKSSFPFDLITEVPKGVKGADCIQTVRNAIGQECGKIIFESKRTENFGGDWIDKLKADMLSQNAQIAVIVTKTMPKGMEQFGEKNGVYICSFREVVSLTTVLRNAIVKIHESEKSQENKGDKIVALYNYLTSQEFKGNWMIMKQGFEQLQQMLNKERDDFEKNWKRKSKQIDMIILNSSQIIGSIQGISGQDLLDMQLDDSEPNNLPEVE